MSQENSEKEFNRFKLFGRGLEFIVFGAVLLLALGNPAVMAFLGPTVFGVKVGAWMDVVIGGVLILRSITPKSIQY